MWGALKLEQSIVHELQMIEELLTTIMQNSTDPQTVEEAVNLTRLSTRTILVLMKDQYKSVTRLGNVAHEGRIAELEQQVAGQQQHIEEMRATIEEMKMIQFRRKAE
jgi:hypothetical protein